MNNVSRAASAANSNKNYKLEEFLYAQPKVNAFEANGVNLFVFDCSVAKMTSELKLLYGYLAALHNKHYHLFPRIEKIATTLGFDSLERTRELVAQLEHFELVSFPGTLSKGTTKVYTFCVHPFKYVRVPHEWESVNTESLFGASIFDGVA